MIAALLFHSRRISHERKREHYYPAHSKAHKELAAVSCSNTNKKVIEMKL